MIRYLCCTKRYRAIGEHTLDVRRPLPVDSRRNTDGFLALLPMPAKFLALLQTFSLARPGRRLHRSSPNNMRSIFVCLFVVRLGRLSVVLLLIRCVAVVCFVPTFFVRMRFVVVVIFASVACVWLVFVLYSVRVIRFISNMLGLGPSRSHNIAYAHARTQLYLAW